MRSSLTLSTFTSLCFGLALSCWTGCPGDASQTSSYSVLVRAVDDLGKPLPEVQLSAAGATLGVTDATGQRALSLPGTEGERVDLIARCPDGYAGPRERPAFLLKHVRDLQGGLSEQPIEVNLTCDATSHVALVAIHTAHAGLPVMLRGQAVARTSDAGTAHVMLREPVGNSFQLTLDTSAKPELRPESPTHMFAVTHQDAFAVWDQPFELEKKRPEPKVRKRGGRRRAAAAPTAAPAPPPPPPKHIPERLN
jgi:hypothetical protein